MWLSPLHHVLLPRNSKLPPRLHLPSSCALFSSSSSVSILHVHSTIHCLVASPHSYKSDITLITRNLLSSFTWTHKNMCTSGLCFMYSCHNSFSLLRLTPMMQCICLVYNWASLISEPHTYEEYSEFVCLNCIIIHIYIIYFYRMSCCNFLFVVTKIASFER